MTTRTSQAHWRGDLKGGDGTVEVGAGAMSGAYTFASRFEEGEGTNPEELAGAAHAACFSMFLANVLDQAGAEVTDVRTTASVELGRDARGPAVNSITLATRVQASGIDQAGFEEQVAVAKDNCPISKLFAGTEIEVDATLAT